MTAIELRPFVESSSVWDGLAARWGTPFHEERWLTVLQSTLPAVLHRIGVYRDAELLGILPLFERRILPFTVGASPLNVESTPYLGFAVPPDILAESIVAIRSYARRHGLQFVRFLQWATPEAIAPSETASIIVRHTHVLNLSGNSDDVWKALSGKCRNQVRKAEKSAVTVQAETSADSMKEFYWILSEVYRLQHMPIPLTLAYFQGLQSTFVDGGLRLYAARIEGKMVSGAIVLHGRDRAYYLNGGSLREFNPLCPNYLVQWTALREAQAAGMTSYDFVGSDIPRLAKFKASFGGELVRYALVEIASSRLVQFARVQYPRAKSLLTRLRRGFATLGPHAGSSGEDTPR